MSQFHNAEPTLIEFEIQTEPLLIAYLSLEAIGGTEESHAVVVVESDDQTVIMYDPLYGERRISRQSF